MFQVIIIMFGRHEEPPVHYPLVFHQLVHQDEQDPHLDCCLPLLLTC